MKVDKGDQGWFGSGLRAIKPWEKETYEEYWKEKLGDENAHVPYDEASQKKYRLFLCKTVSTPGTIAATELFVRSTVSRYRPYLHQYTPEWEQEEQDSDDETSTPFEDSMFQMALASTKFMLATLERWQRWCNMREIPKNRESFAKFSEELPMDMEMSRMILERMHLFSTSFANIHPARENIDTHLLFDNESLFSLCDLDISLDEEMFQE